MRIEIVDAKNLAQKSLEEVIAKIKVAEDHAEHKDFEDLVRNISDDCKGLNVITDPENMATGFEV